MSTALITALRESVGYLRDGGYKQTAQLADLAAEEIERLNLRVQALESSSPRRAEAHLKKTVSENTTQAGSSHLAASHHGK